MRVRITGAKLLPSSVSRDRLSAACVRLAEWFGIDRTITVRVRDYNVGYLGSVTVEGCRKPVVVDLYANAISEYARARKQSMRELYAVVIAHEFVHLSQGYRGSSGIPDDVEEAEATALEKVYAPHVLRILQGKKEQG